MECKGRVFFLVFFFTQASALCGQRRAVPLPLSCFYPFQATIPVPTYSQEPERRSRKLPYLEINHRQKILIRLIRWVQTSILQTEICFFKSQGNQKRQTTSCNKKMGGPKPDCIGMAKIVLAWISNGNQCCEISNMFC